MISCAEEGFLCLSDKGPSEVQLLDGPRQEARTTAMTKTTSTDLADWLGRQGLSQYAKTFAENHIDLSVLPDLTESDLEKLGVSSLGHRKKLLTAIKALTAARQPTGTPPAISSGPVVSPSPEKHREAEFRQITVMFCDLVGSTQLSEKLDPEDLQKLIDAYRVECSAAIARYGGEVARYFGDGVMAFFGWPRAHEDDALNCGRILPSSRAPPRSKTDCQHARHPLGCGAPSPSCDQSSQAAHNRAAPRPWQRAS